MKRVAIYARSSPACPFTADEQIKRLTTVAIERGWTVAHVFADRPTAVKNCQDRRSGELALVEAIRKVDEPNAALTSAVASHTAAPDPATAAITHGLKHG